jgi:hypothetical protein
MKRMIFRANGHLLSVPDGQVIMIIEDDGFGRAFSPELPFPCQSCDASPWLRIAGDAAWMQGPCPYAGGITTIVTLAVPSGKLIVSDSLRPVYDWQAGDLTVSYNSLLGQHQAMVAMERAGCAFGPVGNTSPGLFSTGGDSYAIASLDYYPGDGETGLSQEEATPQGWTLLAKTCTDLWAYSIADFEDWASRGGNALALGYGDTVISVPPGDYQFTHHTGERSFDSGADGTVIYAHVTRIREGNYAP